MKKGKIKIINVIKVFLIFVISIFIVYNVFGGDITDKTHSKLIFQVIVVENLELLMRKN